MFAIGECAHAVVPVADLAPPHLLGRYISLSTLMATGGLALSPATVTVTSRPSASRPATSATGPARPTKLVNAAGKPCTPPAAGPAWPPAARTGSSPGAAVPAGEGECRCEEIW